MRTEIFCVRHYDDSFAADFSHWSSKTRSFAAIFFFAARTIDFLDTPGFGENRTVGDVVSDMKRWIRYSVKGTSSEATVEE